MLRRAAHLSLGAAIVAVSTLIFWPLLTFDDWLKGRRDPPPDHWPDF